MDAKKNVIVENDNKDKAEKKKKIEKKRPGRPRKTPLRKPRPRDGIVSSPSDSTNFIELIYDKPLIFKKLWQYFKLMAVDKIQLIFIHFQIYIYEYRSFG